MKTFPSAERLDRRLAQLMRDTSHQIQKVQGIDAPKLLEEKEERRSQADRIVELVIAQNIHLFQDDLKVPFARFYNKDHWETWPIRSSKFKHWIAAKIWEAEHKTPAPNAIDSALSVISGQASFEGATIALANRVAEDLDGYWYDLADDQWRAILVSPTGWNLRVDTPTLFRRHTHQMPQVLPAQTGGDLFILLRFVNLAKPSDQLLFLVHIVSCFIPDIPHPIAAFYGPQGAAKTTVGRMLRHIIDPSKLETLSMPTTTTELIQQLSHHWFPFFDNITYISDPISDDLCRAVTGGGFSKRELYTNDDDVIYNFRRPIGLNGINLVVRKADILDRSILFELERISKEKRREEKKLWSEFFEAKPMILGGIFDALSKAMSLYPSISLLEAPRMADFATWGCAIAKALGYTQEEFLKAYADNIDTQQDYAIQENPVAFAIMLFMEAQTSWTGSASNLLNALEPIAQRERLDAHMSGWPKAANALMRKLNEVKANLIERGVLITSIRSDGLKEVKIEKIPKNIAPTVQSLTDADIRDIFGAGTIIDIVPESPPISSSEFSTIKLPPDDKGDSGDVSLPF